ncbi:MAG: hypothetical protein CVU89_17410 [Firmicutes bacterium HGW-Firmicutes-14]|nr:MAG: hypothetical protein CVU89_17410 [Firmicutes bacterium HGW-Firmicutes-14]
MTETSRSPRFAQGGKATGLKAFPLSDRLKFPPEPQAEGVLLPVIPDRMIPCRLCRYSTVNRQRVSNRLSRFRTCTNERAVFTAK